MQNWELILLKYQFVLNINIISLLVSKKKKNSYCKLKEKRTNDGDFLIKIK